VKKKATADGPFFVNPPFYLQDPIATQSAIAEARDPNSDITIGPAHAPYSLYLLTQASCIGGMAYAYVIHYLCTASHLPVLLFQQKRQVLEPIKPFAARQLKIVVGCPLRSAESRTP
jgi:hypothetical protein